MQVEYAGVNWLDTAYRTGLVPFPVPPPPKALGGEAAGTIVALPTGENVLSNEEYQARGFRIGRKVAIVSAHSCPDCTVGLADECGTYLVPCVARQRCIRRVHVRTMGECGAAPRRGLHA